MNELQKLHVEAKALFESRGIIHTNAERELALLIVRLIEVLIDGKPATEGQPRHHA